MTKVIGHMLHLIRRPLEKLSLKELMLHTLLTACASCSDAQFDTPKQVFPLLKLKKSTSENLPVKSTQ
jgi:hypothetical protein